MTGRFCADSNPLRNSSDFGGRPIVDRKLSHPDFPLLCAQLNRHSVDYLVIGGWAAIIHGLPRSTLDVDLFVRPTEKNVSRLIEALSQIGHGIARELGVEDILARPVFLFADQIRVDVFTKPWGLKSFDESWENRLAIQVDGIDIPVISLEDLVRSKSTDRPQDIEDIKAIRALIDERKNRE
jgi:predicted nucleotidyltransferase